MTTNFNEKNARHAFEYLTLIDRADTEEKKIELLKKWGGTSPLNLLLSLNFSNVVLDLPEGDPPFNKNETVHPDTCAPLATQINRLKICVKHPNNKSRQMDRERVFIQVLEVVPIKEAEVLLSCKDKALTERYPSVTAELVKKVFPNFVS